MIPILMDFVAEIIEKASKFGFILSDEKDINYGVQLKFEKGDNDIPINIYSSKKKGISTVIGGSNDETNNVHSSPPWKIPSPV